MLALCSPIHPFTTLTICIVSKWCTDRTIHYFSKESHASNRSKAKGKIHLTQIRRVELVQYDDDSDTNRSSSKSPMTRTTKSLKNLDTHSHAPHFGRSTSLQIRRSAKRQNDKNSKMAHSSKSPSNTSPPRSSSPPLLRSIDEKGSFEEHQEVQEHQQPQHQHNRMNPIEPTNPMNRNPMNRNPMNPMNANPMNLQNHRPAAFNV